MIRLNLTAAPAWLTLAPGLRLQVAPLTTALMVLEEPVRAIAGSDSFTIRAGCDKRIATCGTKFANVANFRGLPSSMPISGST